RDRAPRRAQEDGHEERRQEHEPERDAVDAELEVDAERGHPLFVDDVVPVRRIETAEHEQRRGKRDERDGEGEAAQEALFFARQEQAQERAEERQEGRQRQQHYCTFTVSAWRDTVPQRGSMASTAISCFPGES